MAERKHIKRKRRYFSEEERREQILEAAIAVFSDKGYHKTKMQEIASRAGVANGTVYRYFPSKFLLATEIIGARGALGYVGSLHKAGLEELSPEEFLKTTAQRYFGNLKDRLPLIRFRSSEALSNSDLGRQNYKNLLHPLIADLAGFIHQFQNKGFFKQGDPFILGHIYYGILFGFLYCQELMLGKEVTHIDLTNVVDSAVDVFLHGVKSNPTTSN